MLTRILDWQNISSDLCRFWDVCIEKESFNKSIPTNIGKLEMFVFRFNEEEFYHVCKLCTRNEENNVHMDMAMKKIISFFKDKRTNFQNTSFEHTNAPIWPMVKTCDYNNDTRLYIQGKNINKWEDASQTQIDRFNSFFVDNIHTFVHDDNFVHMYRDKMGIFEVHNNMKKYFSQSNSTSVTSFDVYDACKYYSKLYIQGDESDVWWNANESQKEWYDDFFLNIRNKYVHHDAQGIYQVWKNKKKYFRTDIIQEKNTLQKVLSLYKYNFLGNASAFVQDEFKTMLPVIRIIILPSLLFFSSIFLSCK